MITLACLLGSSAFAHGTGAPTPFHLAPGDWFVLPVTSGTFPSSTVAAIRITHVGSGWTTDLPAIEVIADTSVGARLPAALSADFVLGQYTVQAVLAGDAGDPSTERIWVKDREFRLIRESVGNLPNLPWDGHNTCGSGGASVGSCADFKDADFGDFDGDGFLDVFAALSGGDGPNNNDRLYLNQQGRAVRDCTGVSLFCDETTDASFPQTTPGVPDNSRTYDADFADLDLDGDLDIVRIDSSASMIRLFENQGTTITERTLDRLPSLASIDAVVGMTAEVDVRDVNGDDKPDLLTCSWTNGGADGQNGLLINRWPAPFELVNSVPCDPSASDADALCAAKDVTNRGCAFGFIDGDDRLDIVFPTFELEEGVWILINQGWGADGIPSFTLHKDWVDATSGEPLETGSSADLLVVDLDGDNDDDVVLSSPYWGGAPGTGFDILWNDGGTRLVELADDRLPATGGDRDVYDVSAGDLDRDGDIDVMYGAAGSKFGPAGINHGGRDAEMRFTRLPDSAFYARTPGGVGPAPGTVAFELSVSMGDHDLDGDLDLVTGGFSHLGIWTNDLFDDPDEARDWVFSIDRTGSMVDSVRDFLTPARNVGAAFLTQRQAGDAVGLVTFDYEGGDPSTPNGPDDASKAQQIAPVGTTDPFSLRTTVLGIMEGTCGGYCTSIGRGMIEGLELLDTAPVVDPNLPREQVLVLITDGRQNQSPDPESAIATIPSHVRLYTVALGTDTDDRMLSALATNGGKFYFAGRSHDYASVQSALRDIDDDAEAHATGKQVLPALEGLAWSPIVRGTLEKSPLIRGWKPPKQLAALEARTAFARFVVDPDDDWVRFALSWKDPAPLGMVLVDPRGQVVDLTEVGRVRSLQWDRAHAVHVRDPLSGVWTALWPASSAGGPTKIGAVASTRLKVVTKPRFPVFYVGEALELTASLGGVIPGALGEARFTSPSKVEVVVPAVVGGGGVLTFTTPAVTEPGSWRVELTVVGPPERPFLRTATEAVFVAVPTAEEPDLRRGQIRLDKDVLVAGGSDAATATVTVVRRDGAPLPGQQVSLWIDGGHATTPMVDHGDGTYSQSFVADPVAREGRIRPRVGLVRLDVEEGFRVTAGPPDPARSVLTAAIGPLNLCAGVGGERLLRLSLVDANDNGIAGASVTIEATAGGPIDWTGPVQDRGGGSYSRAFRAPEEPGSWRFHATVGGVEVGGAPIVDVFSPDSTEARAIGCVVPKTPKGHSTSWWCCVLGAVLVGVLVVGALVVAVTRRRSP